MAHWTPPSECGTSCLTIRLNGECSILYHKHTHTHTHSLDNGAPVLGLHSSPGTPHILTHSHTLVRGWREQQLYKRSAVIGRDIISMATTTHPLVPRRLLVKCADSAVRVVCPVGGHVITAALLPRGQHITSLVYFPLNGGCSSVCLSQCGCCTVSFSSLSSTRITLCIRERRQG